ncbi:threonine/homoserine/homoserine lactone efflux protein [Murinocardiopsis flavida]|uniref:Threonine/homoserine/homoserine lactone efflux protein n=1 Tax=Murinocardiopsis flavida TaxID=645275 RepID=A0A2P8CLY4_9ACTN|nr:LysE family translocator [Murinocardiopsis flavida]PSK85984.1 threonine/homoserine/homoserine lactone efflux protein [Murinocardiopsis flavida]
MSASMVASLPASQWAAFAAAALVFAAVPGPNQLLSLRNAVQQGTGDAVVGLAGRFTAFAILLAATVAGLGAVLIASETAFTVLKWCGVGYLALLGVRLVWGAWRHQPAGKAGGRADRSNSDEADGRVVGSGGEAGAAPDAPTAHRTRWRLVRQEFLVAMTNPKSMLLFAAFLPQFTDPAAPAAPQLAALGAGYIAIEFAVAVCYTAAGGRLAGTGLTARIRRRIDAGAGLTMIGLAGALAVERR